MGRRSFIAPHWERISERSHESDAEDLFVIFEILMVRVLLQLPPRQRLPIR